jgi:AAA15 family ATPase/GTPase
MIINFSVQNFRSIKEKVLLSFEATDSDDLASYYVINTIASNKKLRLLKLGLIYGANSSGKTTIIEALDFLRDTVVEPSTKKTDLFDFRPFLFDEKSRKGNTLFTLEFVQNELILL